MKKDNEACLEELTENADIDDLQALAELLPRHSDVTRFVYEAIHTVAETVEQEVVDDAVHP